ncbi:hypothetical protein FHW96_001758 [Novosphingobium sp. SG751A]|uniref:hypothetical protein n=1 Tax=Novosphingobium sp. SG751A TaxID=2587000 RepID=UPI0015581B0D|nr:hypothetical protein [Novosphingobium sp. SG751A]NOW45603.1 hypothetical protein [Novosphingobium sp. SG751A]
MAASMLVVLAAAGLVAGAPAQNTQIRSAAAIPVAGKTQLANVVVKRNVGANCKVAPKSKAAAARCTEAQAQGTPAFVAGANTMSTSAFGSFAASFGAPLVGAAIGSLVVQQVIDNNNGTTTIVLSAR